MRRSGLTHVCRKERSFQRRMRERAFRRLEAGRVAFDWEERWGGESGWVAEWFWGGKGGVLGLKGVSRKMGLAQELTMRMRRCRL